MNRILILKTGARFLFLCIFLALVIAIFGENVIHPKYVLLVFFIASMFLTLNFLPTKNSGNKIHDWAVFITCFVSFFVLLGMGFVFPVFFPKIGELYKSQIRTLNIVSVFVIVAAFLTSILSIRLSGGQTRDEDIKNIVKAFDEICKKLNFKNTSTKNIAYGLCSLSAEDNFKDNQIKLKVAYTARAKTTNIRTSKISLKTNSTLEDFNIIVFKEQIEITASSDSKKDKIINFIKEKELDFVEFRSTIIGNNEVFIEVSEAIEDVLLWQNLIEFAEMLTINLDASTRTNLVSQK